MGNPDHNRIFLQGAAVWNEWREHNPSILPDLTEDIIFPAAATGGYNMDAVDLAHAIISGANLSNSNFQNTLLLNTKFSNCKLVNCDFRYAVFIDTQFSNCKLDNCDFRDTDLDGLILDNTDISTIKK